jgi:hypothetical protein
MLRQKLRGQKNNDGKRSVKIDKKYNTQQKIPQDEKTTRHCRRYLSNAVFSSQKTYSKTQRKNEKN